MSSSKPICIPMELSTGLSVGEARDTLREETRGPRGFSMMASRRITGTVSREHIVLRRGVARGWGGGSHHGEFRGNLVAEQGLTVLRGDFVEVDRGWSFYNLWGRENFLAEAELLQEDLADLFADEEVERSLV